MRGALIRLVMDLRRRGLDDPDIMAALEQVPRERFVPESQRRFAYEDRPLALGFGQTISAPSVVLLMARALQLSRQDRVLEIGTGSGYHAAILSHLARGVYTIERYKALAEPARLRLHELERFNVEVRYGDGNYGWPEAAPFDAILLTASTQSISQALSDQLKDGGRLVMPLGAEGEIQRMVRYIKAGAGWRQEDLGQVRFVPLLDGLG